MTSRGPVSVLGWPAAATALAVAGYAGLDVLDFGPRIVPLVLLAVLAATAWPLLADLLAGEHGDWGVRGPRPATPPGQDRGYAGNLRLLEGHLVARVPDTALRDRLAVLAARRLERRHGPVDAGRRAELLGDDVVAVLDGPVRRLGREDVDRCLRRIEEL